MKHTQGPWEVYSDEYFDDHNEVLIQHQGGVVVDRVGTLSSNDATDNAQLMTDAKLIAAAPDLLDACCSVLRSINDLKTDPTLEGCAMVLEHAIRKATD